MNVLFRITNNVVGIIVALTFLVIIARNLDKDDRINRTYLAIFIVTTSELVIETFTCIVDGQPIQWLNPIIAISHMVLFFLSPVVTYLWYSFVRLWLDKDRYQSVSKKVFILMPLVVNTFFVISNPFFNWIFSINNRNVYVRGHMFIIPAASTFCYLLYSLIVLYRNKLKISQVEYLPLVLCCIFPTISGLAQCLIYGILIMWSSIAYSLIMVFIFLQQQMLQTDRLTGAWMREKLINHLNLTIKKNHYAPFSIVFIDLDEFKEINDTYGHGEGDKALVAIVNIMKSAITKEDFITRYGGDEFIIFLNADNKEQVKMVIDKISQLTSKFNKESKKPYKLCFSYGYEIYDSSNYMDIAQYIDHVDRLMYESKRKKKMNK